MNLQLSQRFQLKKKKEKHYLLKFLGMLAKCIICTYVSTWLGFLGWKNLTYNSHTIKFAILMYTVQGFLVYSQDLQSSPLSQIPEHVIIHPPPPTNTKTHIPVSSHCHSLLWGDTATTNLLSVPTDLCFYIYISTFMKKLKQLEVSMEHFWILLKL